MRVARMVVGAFAVGLAVFATVPALLDRGSGDGAPRPQPSLPAPPDSLRDQLPDELDSWVRQGLVLAYMNGDVYHLFSEGVMPHSCPIGAGERNPESCFSTAHHVIWGRDTHGMTVRSGHDLRLSEPPQNREVLWRGVPDEASIGVHSLGACTRIERFDGYYECRDGAPVYVREETQ